MTSRRQVVENSRTGVSVTETQYTVYGSGSTFTSYASWRNGTRSSMIRSASPPQYSFRFRSRPSSRIRRLAKGLRSRRTAASKGTRTTIASAPTPYSFTPIEAVRGPRFVARPRSSRNTSNGCANRAYRGAARSDGKRPERKGMSMVFWISSRSTEAPMSKSR